MRTPARMLAAATLAVLTVLPAGVAQAGVAEEPGRRCRGHGRLDRHHPPTPTSGRRRHLQPLTVVASPSSLVVPGRVHDVGHR
jgi:hypothetical protein